MVVRANERRGRNIWSGLCYVCRVKDGQNLRLVFISPSLKIFKTNLIMSVHPSVTSSTHFRPIKPQGQSVVAQVKSRRKQKRENWNIKVRKHKINAAKRDLLPADCRMQGLSKGILTMVEVSKRSISSSNSSAGQIHEDDSGGVSNHEAKSNSSGGGGGKYSSRAVTNRLVEDAKLLNEIDVSSTMELHRTNLMKMQTQELLSECQITDLSSRKWTADAQQYLQTLTTLIRTKIEIGPSGSGSTPSSSASSNTNTNKKSKGKHKKKSNGQKLVIAGSCRHRADKVVHIDSGSSRSSSDDTSTLHLSVEPIGCTHSNIGWMKKSGNAQVPPTFSLMLMLPQTMFGSKDYLHYRYFDVSRLNTRLMANSKKFSLFALLFTVFILCMPGVVMGTRFFLL